jgi:hypothetical protein
MGCDFYIDVYLEIEHKNGISYCILPSIRGYYCDSLGTGHQNSDDESSDNEGSDNEIICKKLFVYNEMKKLCLTPRKPFIIYENEKFISKKIENKYLPIISKKQNCKKNKYCKYKDTGKFTDISEIIKITKKETRFDPMDYFE